MDNRKLVVTLIWMALVKSSSAITCYDCNSVVHKDRCSEYSLAENSIPSIPCPTVCYKAITKQGGVVKTQRGCLDTIPQPLICLKTTSPFVETTFCHCDTDLCNGGDKVVPVHMLVVVLAIFMVKFFK